MTNQDQAQAIERTREQIRNQIVSIVHNHKQLRSIMADIDHLSNLCRCQGAGCDVCQVAKGCLG